MFMDKRTGKDTLLPISDYYEQWEVLSFPQGYTLVCIFIIFKFYFLFVSCSVDTCLLIFYNQFIYSL